VQNVLYDFDPVHLSMKYLDNTSNNPHHRKADIRLTYPGLWSDP